MRISGTDPLLVILGHTFFVYFKKFKSDAHLNSLSWNTFLVGVYQLTRKLMVPIIFGPP